MFKHPELVGPCLVIASGLIICVICRLFGKETL